MTPRLFSALAACALVFLLAACETAADAPDSAAAGIGNPDRVVVVTRPVGFDPATITPEQRRALSESSRTVSREMRDVLLTSKTWQEADQRMQTLVAEAPAASQAMIAQAAASYMLQSGALDSGGTVDRADRLDAVGTYVTLLADHQSPDVLTVAKGLDQLADHWPSDRIQAVASRTLAVVDATETAEPCEDCGPASRSEVVADHIRQSSAARRDASAQALERLRGLARTAAE